MSASFSFDPIEGRVTGPSAGWILCSHLRPALAAAIAAGARIASVTGPGAWTRIDLDVSLESAPSAETLAAIVLAPELARWSNTDSHYPLQSGISCAGCRQTLSWPLEAA